MASRRRKRSRGPNIARSSDERFAINLVDDGDNDEENDNVNDVKNPVQCFKQNITHGIARASTISRSQSTRTTKVARGNIIQPIITLDDDDYDDDDPVVIIEKTDPNERQTHQSVSIPPRTRNFNGGAKNDDEDISSVEISSIDSVPNFEDKTNNDSSSDIVTEVYPNKRQRAAEDEVEMVIPPRQPEYEVLDVFPDADVEYVKSLLQQHNADVATVIQVIAENPKYPKSDASTRPLDVSFTPNTALVRLDEAETKYDFMSTESFVPDPTYIIEALEQLCSDFPFLSKPGANRILNQCSRHYAICHDKIIKTLKTTPSPTTANGDLQSSKNQYERVLAAMGGFPLFQAQIISIEQLTSNLPINVSKRCIAVLKRPRKQHSQVIITDAILQEEVKSVHSKLKDWMSTEKLKIDRQTRQRVAQNEDNALECACCFDSYAWEDMISCQHENALDSKPHLFCADCIRNILESRMFSDGNLGYDSETKELSIELRCFHGDGCSSGFHRSSLEKVLPSSLMKKYEELQFQLSIKRAGLETTLHACPKCNYQCDVPETQNIFACPVASCLFESCRLCGEASHIPLRCDEVVKDKVETLGRTSVEEAITAAKIRTCPACKKSFIKSDGCNKIRCGCGVFVCYVCRKQINDYSHFCQKPHCTHADCKTCSLYSSSEEDDLRAMREAGINAAALHADANIDVDKILKPPPNPLIVDPFQGFIAQR